MESGYRNPSGLITDPDVALVYALAGSALRRTSESIVDAGLMLGGDRGTSADAVRGDAAIGLHLSVQDMVTRQRELGALILDIDQNGAPADFNSTLVKQLTGTYSMAVHVFFPPQ